MTKSNKVAIVTGAGGGIGQVYAEALAREGAAVVIAEEAARRRLAIAARGRGAGIQSGVSSGIATSSGRPYRDGGCR